MLSASEKQSLSNDLLQLADFFPNGSEVNKRGHIIVKQLGFLMRNLLSSLQQQQYHHITHHPEATRSAPPYGHHHNHIPQQRLTSTECGDVLFQSFEQLRIDLHFPSFPCFENNTAEDEGLDEEGGGEGLRGNSSSSSSSSNIRSLSSAEAAAAEDRASARRPGLRPRKTSWKKGYEDDEVMWSEIELEDDEYEANDEDDDSDGNDKEDFQRSEEPLPMGKYIGVSQNGNQWQAYINVITCKHLGLYDTEIEAAKAHDRVAKTIPGRILNFIEDEVIDSETDEKKTKKPKEKASPEVKSSTWSKYIGVSKKGSKWRAKIKVKGVGKYLGSYETEVEAAHAFDRAAKPLGRASNFPEGLDGLQAFELTRGPRGTSSGSSGGGGGRRKILSSSNNSSSTSIPLSAASRDRKAGSPEEARPEMSYPRLGPSCDV